LENRAGIVIAAIILVVALVAGWAFITSGQQERSSTPITEVADQASIQNSVQLSHLSIATSENFARQKIYVISSYLKNVSDKPLRMAEVKMTFTDFDGKPIHEYRQKVLDKNEKPLPPGTQLRFEVRQENLPRGWNYRVPITEIVKLGY
jgi:archaellin